MSENRLPDYLEHMRQAATNARSFVDGMKKEDFSSRQAHAAGRHHVLSHHRRGRYENHGPLP